ncbi:Chaperone protein HscA [Mycobacterium kansasii]|uniref:Chaperone protein HscA n=4 Tax=Mycobacterium kansasii TaxID=1768 RepID=A0A653EIQ3_MYCKA|nr:Hsp70 family protein [Mycobacterium kansasii]VAZ59743.1 Chaperone protein HscA [Mycobacterium kansasii]VAZ66063.1 Chaperone protein HscA [Mycobacterium kansasii]VAZ74010.1 Chaperone protein HscA [Mycobacterium kansasii]VTO97356.1 chaperone protein HscA [Mycobacterium kansasii]
MVPTERMQGEMTEPLGLSVGVANLVAARTGSAPVTRSSVLTLFNQRAPEVGTPEENPNAAGPGLALSGFVERVADNEPLIAADGSAHSGAAIAAGALDAIAGTVGYGAPVAIAVPAHWGERQVGALREALRGHPDLAPGAVQPALIGDAAAALAALYAKPGFPTDGIVVLCDFGASGSSVTLTDAASNFRQIAPTQRYTDFTGNQLDQMILRHLAVAAGDADGTAPLAPLSRRLAQCRSAKEQLSAATVAVIPAELPGIGEDVRLTRAEFEDLISGPLQLFISCVEEVLQRNQIPQGRLAAIATVGGGASIPLITSRLSERLQVPIVTTAQPRLNAAIGAAVLAQMRSSAVGPPPQGAVGYAAVGTAAAETEGDAAALAPTEVVPSAWAVGASRAAAGEASVDGDQSATYRALAWSQEAAAGDPAVPGVDYGDAGAGVTADTERPDAHSDDASQRTHWYGRSSVLISVTGAAAVALVIAAVLAVKFGAAKSKPVNNTRVITPPVESSQLVPAPPPASNTGSVTPSTIESTESVTTPPATTVATTQPPVPTTHLATTYPTPPAYPTTTNPANTYSTTPYPPASKSLAPVPPPMTTTLVPVRPPLNP